MEGLRSQCESGEFISPSVLHPSACISGPVLTLSIPILPILLFLIFKNFYQSLVTLQYCVSVVQQSESAIH